MTEAKILVHNINDVVNRAAFEKELNVYLKMGWKLNATHQAVSPETGFLMMTAVLEKEAEENQGAEDSKQSAVKEKPKEDNKQEAAKELTENSGQNTEKKQDSKQDTVSEKTASEEATIPKGFKIKEKKEDSSDEKEPAEEAKETEEKESSPEAKEESNEKKEEETSAQSSAPKE